MVSECVCVPATVGGLQMLTSNELYSHILSSLFVVDLSLPHTRFIIWGV